MISTLILWTSLGIVYTSMEVIWRLGQTHPSMLIVGGISAGLVGLINQVKTFYKLPIIFQSLIGTIIVLLVEFISGCIINLWLGWAVWDYSGVYGNILGQVCIPYAFLWLAIMPFAIWAEDTGRWLVYMWRYAIRGKETEPPEISPYTLKSIYKEFITLK